VIGRLWEAAAGQSPRENIETLRRKIRNRLLPGSVPSRSAVVPDPRRDFALATLAVTRLAPSERVVGLLGALLDAAPFRSALMQAGREPVHITWSWGPPPQLESAIDALIVCRPATTAAEWDALRSLRRTMQMPVYGPEELLLPFAPLAYAQRVLPYFEETASLETIAPFYLGRDYFRPIDKLDAVFPLKGLSIIEFGPMDGALTAGLVAAGASRIVAVEARPENYLKTLIAKDTFGWDHVELVADDFHNASGQKYGRFDLVFAHGVYYHSVAPFLFLENTLSLSDAVYVGGFCATDDLPEGPWVRLTYKGQQYAAKRYDELLHQMVAGINAVGYFFHPDDLGRWFRDQDYHVTELSNEPSGESAGRYVRLIARR
jgi:hypothetical protein